jgi:uncharacterized membrane protein YfhO
VCLASSGLTVLILSVVYALRGIWPFGTDNVAYVDTAQFYLPDYYSVWDVLHGTATANTNWFAGLIERANANFATFTKPANYVFAFVTRDHVLEALSLYLMVSLVLIALITALVLCLRFPKLRPVWKIALTMAYTFSGFVLQYYANLFWLWIVAIFPLFLFSLERLLRDGKYILYTLLYAYYLHYHIYYAYMVTLYVLVFTLGYCVFLLPRDKRGDRLLRLGLSTLAALGLTAYDWLGSSSSIAGSSRFQSNLDSGLLSGFTTWNLTNTRHTVLMLLGMAFVFVLVLRALVRLKKADAEMRSQGKKPFYFLLYLLVMFALPMVFTNIDTAWHFGQYNFFPMRYGYMLPATLLAAAALCLEQEQSLPPTQDAPKHPGVFYGLAWIAAVALAFVVPAVTDYWKEYGSCFLTALGKVGYLQYFALYIGSALLYAALYGLLFRLKRSQAAYTVCLVLLVQLCFNAYGLVAPSDDHTYTREYDPAYVDKADALYDYFSQQDISPLARAKNVDNSLNAAYPTIAGVSAVSSVNSSNSNLRLGVYQELGYSINYFRILDTGGTVFSDMLLGVDYVLSAQPLDESLYDHGDVVEGIEVGTAKYPGQIGLMFPTGALDDYLDLLTMPQRLNALYQAFTGTQGEISSTPRASLSMEGEGLAVYTLTIDLEEDEFVYLAADGILMNITAQGTDITVPTYENGSNRVYPAAFNNNLLYLGRYEPGTLTVTFQSASALTLDDLTLVALRADRVESFYSDAYFDESMTLETSEDSIAITVTADQEGLSLFLPITYSGRWSATINGEAVSPTYCLGTFMSLPLTQGENVITLVRGSSHLTFGRNLVISLVFLVLCLGWLLWQRFCPRVRSVGLPQPVYTGVWWLFLLVCLGVFGFVYLAPTYYLLTQGTIVTF